VHQTVLYIYGDSRWSNFALQYCCTCACDL